MERTLTAFVSLAVGLAAYASVPVSATVLSVPDASGAPFVAGEVAKSCFASLASGVLMFALAALLCRSLGLFRRFRRPPSRALCLLAAALLLNAGAITARSKTALSTSLASPHVVHFAKDDQSATLREVEQIILGTNGKPNAAFASRTTIETLVADDGDLFDSVFSTETPCVYIEGGECGAASDLEPFFTKYGKRIEDWVRDGGRLLVNAAPDDHSSCLLPFGAVLTGGTTAETVMPYFSLLQFFLFPTSLDHYAAVADGGPGIGGPSLAYGVIDYKDLMRWNGDSVSMHLWPEVAWSFDGFAFEFANICVIAPTDCLGTVMYSTLCHPSSFHMETQYWSDDPVIVSDTGAPLWERLLYWSFREDGFGTSAQTPDAEGELPIAGRFETRVGNVAQDAVLIDVHNRSTNTLDVIAYEECDWLQVKEPSRALEPGEDLSGGIRVTLAGSARFLPVGVYTGSVVVANSRDFDPDAATREWNRPGDPLTTPPEYTYPSAQRHWFVLEVIPDTFTLDVSNEHATCYPQAGRTVWARGDNVRAIVDMPKPTNRVQYVCTGWTGTGSVPASGTASSVSFRVFENSTLAWLWETNVWVECAVYGGTSDFEAGWVPLGASRNAVVAPADEKSVLWIEGDADSVELAPDGRTLSIPTNHPRNVAVFFDAIEGDISGWGHGDAADAAWHAVADSTAVDGISLRSGAIGIGETSALEIHVSGIGEFSFQWRVSTSQDGRASFLVDDVLERSIATTTDWVRETFFLEPGDHTLRWTYANADESAADEDAAFLDAIRWSSYIPELKASPVHRFYSPRFKGHFFTTDENEKNHLIDNDRNWNYEGEAYGAFTNELPGTVALHRFYSPNYRGHFFTIDESEMRTVRDTNPNWKYEGIAFYVYPSPVSGTVPAYRFWSKAYRHHFYTTSATERDFLIANNPNWKYEAIAFWALPAPGAASSTAVSPGSPATAPRASPPPGGDSPQANGKTPLEKQAPCPLPVATGGTPVSPYQTGVSPVPWSLTAPPKGAVVALRGGTDLGDMFIETRKEAPEFAEMACLAVSPHGSKGFQPERIARIPLRLSLPKGSFNAQLWSLTEGLLLDEVSSGVFDFELPADGAWRWVRILDADGKAPFALWLRAEGL